MSVEINADPTSSNPFSDSYAELESGKTAQFYSGFINFVLNQPYVEGDTLDQVDVDEELGDLLAYLWEGRFPPPVRPVHSVSAERIKELEEGAYDSPYPPLRSLNQYWVLDAREHQEELADLASTLMEKFAAVAYAYPEVAAIAPLHNAVLEPGFPTQAYLHAAPAGIGATWVWENLGIFGEGVNLVDLEQNWDLNHAEFIDIAPQKEQLGQLNNSDPQHEAHGTAVLGILCAGVNGSGGVGIAPGLDNVWVLSHFRLHPVVNQVRTGQVADAIVAMLDSGHLSFGDVLLLEVERGAGVPTETDILDLDAIRLAVSQGITVIEPAGNAGINLDHYHRFLASQRILNPDLETEFVESGAILIGASAPEFQPGKNPRHRRYALSNYGSRVNCFAWGTNVATIGFDSAAGQRFGGTSAASAIIAGAAALLQSAHKTTTGSSLMPDAMRLWLSDPSTGIAQWQSAGKPIGAMPNLEAIITNRL